MKWEAQDAGKDNVNTLYIAFWGALICANVWMAADKWDRGLPWLALSAVALIAHCAQTWSNPLAGFWSRVWGR